MTAPQVGLIFGRPKENAPNGTFSREFSMAIAAERKTDLIGKFRTHESDTGSPEVQIALLTDRIVHLTEHFKTHAKDHHSRRGLLQLVSRRRGLLDYLMRNNFQRYRAVIKELGIRK